MRSRIMAGWLAGAILAGIAINGSLSGAGFGAGSDDVILDPVIAGPIVLEAGGWRTRTQSVLDSLERKLVRRVYTVWDPAPSRNLDFTWIADSPHDDREGRINGSGRLIWRMQGKPSYDRSAVVAEYRGAMTDGRAEGQGRYVEASGLSYEGEWKSGLMDGFGRLMLRNSDEYIGQMRAGKANGAGRYFDVTGEIFEGHFVDGKRDGQGTTTLPNGNSYRSRWVLGQEAEDSRLVRLAQSTGQLAQAGASDIRIGITVRSKARDERDLTYTASAAGPKLSIRPNHRRLMSMWKGDGEIQLRDEGESAFGVFSLPPGALVPLTLVFEVQNQSSAPIAVTGAYLAVESSVSDLQPAVQLNRNGMRCGDTEYEPSFLAENFGWSAAENASMRFAFTNPNVSARPTNLNVSKKIDNIVREIRIHLEPELRSAGVNIATLRSRSKTGFICKLGSMEACLEQIKASGVFGKIAAQVGLKDTGIFVAATGMLDYHWRDSRGNVRRQSSPYSVNLPLGRIKVDAECGEGGEPDVVAAKPLQFRLDQSGYRLPVSFQRSVPARRTSQFTVTVNAEKSSQHDFTVVLQLADGREIVSRPINLLYYRPSWFAVTN